VAKSKVVLDTDRIDDAVLALLCLGRHGGFRAWKGFDWEAMNRLHEKGMTSDPVGKAKPAPLSPQTDSEAWRAHTRRAFFSECRSRFCYPAAIRQMA
jgi:hypothetical protein